MKNCKAKGNVVQLSLLEVSVYIENGSGFLALFKVALCNIFVKTEKGVSEYGEKSTL